MAQHRKDKEKAPKIKLAKPDRSGPDPTRETLLDIAAQRNLSRAQQKREREIKSAEAEILVGRLGESILWSTSLTMLHLTLDVLVANQYAEDIDWSRLARRTGQAFPIILLLFYSFHPHASPSVLLPTLPRRIQSLAHELFFFVCAIIAGCYMIFISNTYGYYAVMKQAAPLGCLWIWSVIELSLPWAVGSLVACGTYLKYFGYSVI